MYCPEESKSCIQRPYNVKLCDISAATVLCALVTAVKGNHKGGYMRVQIILDGVGRLTKYLLGHE